LLFGTLIHRRCSKRGVPPWVKFQSAGWGNFRSASTLVFKIPCASSLQQLISVFLAVKHFPYRSPLALPRYIVGRVAHAKFVNHPVDRLFSLSQILCGFKIGRAKSPNIYVAAVPVVNSTQHKYSERPRQPFQVPALNQSLRTCTICPNIYAGAFPHTLRVYTGDECRCQSSLGFSP
jgi:hypothetical protein